MLAAMNGHVLIIRELLHLAGLDLNKCDNEGNTALHLAAQAGVLKQVEDQWTNEDDVCFFLAVRSCGRGEPAGHVPGRGRRQPQRDGHDAADEGGAAGSHSLHAAAVAGRRLARPARPAPLHVRPRVGALHRPHQVRRDHRQGIRPSNSTRTALSHRPVPLAYSLSSSSSKPF